MKYELCHFTPPKEIYQVLNEAQEKGIILPENVNDWLLTEVVIETKQNIKDFKKEIKNVNR